MFFGTFAVRRFFQHFSNTGTEIDDSDDDDSDDSRGIYISVAGVIVNKRIIIIIII